MAVPGAEDDCSFCPSNDRLVDRYLRAKIDGRISDLANVGYFLDADVCSARPQELVRHHTMPARVSSRDSGDGLQFYFFSPARFVGTAQRKRSRVIDGTGEKESWHAEGRPKPVEGSTAGGYMTKLSYHVRNGTKFVEKPGWIMTEYSFKNTGAGDTVLCKIYKSPRGPGRSTSYSSSCTFSAESGCKRKAADDLEGAMPSTRPRHTDQEEGDDLLFAGDLERNLLSAEDHAAAPEVGETLRVEESQPEPQTMPASFDITPDEMLRHTNEEQGDDMLFATDLEHNLLSAEDHAAAPEVGEMLRVEESQPEPQIVPASFDIKQISDQMLNCEVENGVTTTLLSPDGEDFEAYHKRFWGSMIDNTEQQDTPIQTVYGPLAEGDVMAALASGVTVDELLPDGSCKSGCKRKAVDDLEEGPPSTRLRQTDQEVDDAMLFTGGDTLLEDLLLLDVLHVEEGQPEPQVKPASFNGDMGPEELPNRTMTEEEDDRRTLLIPDGGDPEAYFKEVLFVDKSQEAAVQTVHDPLMECYVSAGSRLRPIHIDDQEPLQLQSSATVIQPAPEAHLHQGNNFW